MPVIYGLGIMGRDLQVSNNFFSFLSKHGFYFEGKLIVYRHPLRTLFTSFYSSKINKVNTKEIHRKSVLDGIFSWGSEFNFINAFKSYWSRYPSVSKT